jgi:hypothetical protein
MGQQQLLAILLGTIVVSIAVAFGITMFSDSAINANRDALCGDLVILASRAQEFYRRPTALNGGGNSFDLLTTDAIARLTDQPRNGNGSYFIETAGSGTGTNAVVVIKGIGTELNNGSSVAVHVFVYPGRDSMVTIN